MAAHKSPECVESAFAVTQRSYLINFAFLHIVFIPRNNELVFIIATFLLLTPPTVQRSQFAASQADKLKILRSGEAHNKLNMISPG